MNSRPQSDPTRSKGVHHVTGSRVTGKCHWTVIQMWEKHTVVQAGFIKGRGTRDQIANICWIIKKLESSSKTSVSALLTMPKPLTVWITINCGKFWKRWEYQTTWPASWEICMQVRKNWTWNNRLVPNRKRSMSRLYIVTLLV